MTNLQVINKFLNKETAKTPTRYIQGNYYYYKGNTLTTDGKTLINYNTIIATWENDYIIVNVRKYSNTTSHIQHALIREIEKRRIFYIKEGVKNDR